MNLKIFVYSLENFKNQGIDDKNLSQDDYYIGIHSSGWIHSISVFKQDHRNVLNLWFDDVESDCLKIIDWFNNTHRIIYARACTVDQASQLIKFINKIPFGASLHIYCAKGQSRSPAVANFVRKYLNKEQIDPDGHNKHVFRLLENAWLTDKDFL